MHFVYAESIHRPLALLDDIVNTDIDYHTKKNRYCNTKYNANMNETDTNLL